MGTAINHPVPARVKPSFEILTSGHSDAQPWASECPVLSLRLSCFLAARIMRPDSLRRLSLYINPLLTYLLTYLITLIGSTMESYIYIGLHGSTFLNAWSTSWLSSPTSPVYIDDQPTCIAWSFRGIDAARSVGGPSLSGSDRLEYTACRTAWTGCERRRLSAHIKDAIAREILVHRAQLRCVAWNCAIFMLALTLTTA